MKELDYYEEVIIRRQNGRFAHLNDKIGIIIGKALDEQTDKWVYSVLVKSECVCYSIWDSDLDVTGIKYKREDLFSGQHVRLLYNPKTEEVTVLEAEGVPEGKNEEGMVNGSSDVSERKREEGNEWVKGEVIHRDVRRENREGTDENQQGNDAT